MRPGPQPPKKFFTKSFYWPKGSDFSSRFQRCLGGPSGVHTAAPTCRSAPAAVHLYARYRGWVGGVWAVFAVLSQRPGWLSFGGMWSRAHDV